MDVVLFTLNDKWWDWQASGFTYRTAQIASRMSSHRSVDRLLVVDVPSSFLRAGRSHRGPAGGGSDDGVDPQRLGQGFTITSVGERVSVLDHVRLMPRERHRPYSYVINNALHDALLRRAIRRSIEMLGMQQAVALHAGPLTAHHAGAIGERACVYDARDDWLVHPAFAAMTYQIDRGYRRIRADFDAVTAVSPAVAARFKGASPAVHVVPNAVGWSPEAIRDLDMPPDVAAVPGPRVAYIGALDERVDVEMLRAVADGIDGSLCIVGPVHRPELLSELRTRRNVYVLGRKNHSEIPACLAAFDVFVMPHRDTVLTRRMDPLKLYEYAAAGRPAVVSGVEPHPRFEGFARREDDADRFVDAVRAGLSGEWTIDPCIAEAFARANSWEARLERLLSIMDAEHHRLRSAPQESRFPVGVSE